MEKKYIYHTAKRNKYLNIFSNFLRLDCNFYFNQIKLIMKNNVFN